MRKITLLALACLFSAGATYAQQSTAPTTRNCSAMDVLEQHMAQDPSIQKRMHQMENFTQRRIKEFQNTQGRIVGDVIQIPVVVHVLYTNSTNNISNAQIQSQLDVLNADFRRTNSDRDNKWNQAADTKIEFYLAEIDPNGNATTGITRKRVSKSNWGTNDAMKKASSGGVDPWNTAEYLNMWVVDNMTSGGRTILGYAQFPWDTDKSTDGVVMADQFFGTVGTAQAPFDGGRTTTHEVGHFFGLRHIWGDSSNCSVDDYVDDTPLSNAATSGCGEGKTTCGSLDMTENYMDYSDDSCLNLFTLGQKNRMHTYLQAGGERRALALSDKKSGSNPDPDPDPSCTNNEVTLSITLDNYPQETSWILKNDAGQTITSGSYSTSNPDGSTVTETFCLPNDCYTFTINDSAGDGICCSYGNGSYTLSGPDGTIKSGGNFAESEATDFCFNGAITPPAGDTMLFEGSFESGLDGWSDGGTDCYRYSGQYSYDGNYSIRLRDDSGSASAMTSPTYDIRTYNEVEVKFYFYANSMENGEDFWLRYYNGSSWETVGSWSSGTSFENGSFYSATVNVKASEVNFVNNAKFRIQCDASSDYDQVYIDKITIKGINGNSRVGNSLREISSLEGSQKHTGIEQDLAIYPNPVSGNTLFVKALNDKKATYRVINILGQTLQNGNLTKELNISTLKPGVYLLEINDGEELETKKFIKK